MRQSYKEKLEKKIVKCYEGQHFYSMFEDSIDQAKNPFIVGGSVIVGVGLILGTIPVWLLLTSLVAIGTPLVTIAFSRMMQQFYNDRGEYLKEKLEKHKTQEQTSSQAHKTTTAKKEETNLVKNAKTQNSVIKKNRTKHSKQQMKDENTLDL